MAAIDEALVFAQDLTFGHHHNALWIYAHADRPVGERCRDTVTIRLQMDEAGWRHPLGMLDESVERPRGRHLVVLLF